MSMFKKVLKILMGVLVAISIPIFTAQLEKAREATDMANIRSAYAEASAAALTNEDWTTTAHTTDSTFTNYTYTKAADNGSTWAVTIKARQTSTTNGTNGWANGKPEIGGQAVDAGTTSYTVTVKADGTCTIATN